MIRLIFILLFLTGATGLIYQVIWQKYLAILLGSHASSTAAILALFFVFMSLGYSIIGKFSTRIMKNQLLLYGIIELLIGMYALYSHPFFDGIYELFVERSSTSGGGLGFALLICALFIGFPTFLMGGTIPVLTQALSKTHDMSTDIHARVYGLNTLGAVLGCLLAGFFMIENFGLQDSLVLAGNLNVLIFIATLVIIRKSDYSFQGPIVEATASPRINNAMWLVVVSFLSGFYTFGFETLLIRMVGLSVGSTSYVYSTVVSAFIVSIAIGSLVIARSKRATEPKFLVYTLIGAIMTMWLVYLSIPEWPVWFHRVKTTFYPSNFNFGVYNFVLLLFISVLLVVPVSLIGANLPVLFNIIQSRDQDLSSVVGRLYSVNAVGSGFGAVIMGYLIFQVTEADVSFRLCLLSLVLATFFSVFIVFHGRDRKIYLSALAALSLLVWFSPSWPVNKFVPGGITWGYPPKDTLDLSNFYDSKRSQYELLFSVFDPNTHASVMTDGEGSTMLLVNGKADAGTGKQSDASARAMAALTPMAIKSDPVEDIFIVGLGAGLSTGIFSSFPEVKSIDVAEISVGVVEALPYFKDFNYKLAENRDKVNISVGDAYRELMIKNKKYDLVVSEPSNPWVSGSEKIFTKEFYRVARSRMKPKAYYVQWFPLFSMPDRTVSKIFATFQSVFPNTLVMAANGGALTLIGSAEEINVDAEFLMKRFKSFPDAYRDFGYSSPQSIWMKQLLTPLQVSIVGHGIEDLHTLYNPDLEYKSGRALFASQNTKLGESFLWQSVLPFDRTSVSGGLYLFEQAKGHLSEAAFQEALSTSKSVYWDFHTPWLMLNHLRLFPRSKNFEGGRKSLTEMQYLLGMREKWNEQELKKDPEAYLKRLLLHFRTLQAFGEKPKITRIQKFLDLYCPGEKCKGKLKTVLSSIGPREQAIRLQKSPLKSIELEWLRSKWGEVMGTYKKFGSY